ncbi:MAG: carboxymuconolactone decarboxylase family protein [Calditrichaeota bacterium]|nr:carboxymuconolactone decarboxylase family protein [Calditrichota bacterium]
MKRTDDVQVEQLPPELKAFWEERERLNEIVFEQANLTIKRFFSLDGQAYREGALSARTKEMLGLVASLVLRCDDCIKYHVIRCHQEGISDAEFGEALSVGLVVGGSIVIPHLRRAFRWWKALKEAASGAP